MDSLLFTQYLIAGIVIGIIYALMAIGITFIYSIMKMINWSMGEYYMMGSYLQYFLVVYVLGAKLWFLGIPLSMAVVFGGLCSWCEIMVSGYPPFHGSGFFNRDDCPAIFATAHVCGGNGAQG
jgi:branched-chain amino acid transport system permease protein